MSQNRPSTGGPPPPRSGARLTYAAQAAVVLFAMLTCTVLALILSARLHRHALDVTATRAHALSPETAALLARLQTPVTVVVSVNHQQVTRQSLQRLDDVIDKFARASDKLTFVSMDLGTEQGRQQQRELIARLAREDRAQLEAASAALARAADAADALAARCEAVVAPLTQVAQALVVAAGGAGSRQGDQLRAGWEQLAALYTSQAREVRAAAKAARQLKDARLDSADATRTDQAARQLRPAFNTGVSILRALDQRLAQLADGPEAGAIPASGPAREALTALRAAVPLAADEAARELLLLDSLPPIRTLQVDQALAQTAVVLFIGPAPPAEPSSRGSANAPASPARPSVAYEPIEELLASASLAQAPTETGRAIAALDRRFKVEERLTAGIAGFIDRARPLVVFVHALQGRLQPPPPGRQFAPMRVVAERLALRGCDLAEWAVRESESPPPAASSAASAGRPVVYVFIPDDARAAGDSLVRTRLAKAQETLAAAGAQMLVCVNPSRDSKDTSGIEDPLTTFLLPLGLSADSGRVLVEPVRAASGRSVPSFDLALLGAGTDHPLAGPLDGRPLVLPWVCPLRITADAAPGPGGVGTTVRPLLLIQPRSGLWADAEWHTLRATPQAQWALLPPLSPESPLSRRSGPEPWLAGVTIERPLPPGAPRPAATAGKPAAQTQRMVVIGSNGWFFDNTTDLQDAVEGRVLYRWPGNAELFMNSVAWLAHDDDLIARSPAAQPSPTIPALTDGQQAALRWGLMLGLPVLVLVTGALLRLLRG